MFHSNVNFIVFFCIFLYQLILVVAHNHGHAHNEEPPHLKYTREVNEATTQEEHDSDHLHNQHEHFHDVGHEHSHACGGHHHSHSHDGRQGENNGRMASTLPKISIATNNDKPYAEDSYLSFLNDPKVRLWTYAVGSTLLISAVPCFLLLLIPIKENNNHDSPLLRTLLAFGAGGLLGDAFLHLIPHAMPIGHSHSHSHSSGDGHAHGPHDLSVGSWVLVGFMTFFIVEKFVRIMRGNDPPGHGHSHQHKNQKKKKIGKSSDDEMEEKLMEKEDEAEKNKKPVGRIRVAAFLNLVADFMHNFTDGLAIGASFVAGTMVGVVTVVTVLVHEIPHEIGDFAILVQSGFSRWRATLIQLCTALGALFGCVISLWHVDAAALAEAAEQSWAIPFTAGGFIYIGTVSMIPDLLEKSTVFQSLKEVCALLLGLAMMYAIAFFE